LIDNIFAMVGGCFSTDSPMGTNCVPFLVDLFL